MHDENISPFWEFVGIGLAVVFILRAIMYWWSYK